MSLSVWSAVSLDSCTCKLTLNRTAVMLQSSLSSFPPPVAGLELNYDCLVLSYAQTIERPRCSVNPLNCIQVRGTMQELAWENFCSSICHSLDQAWTEILGKITFRFFKIHRLAADKFLSEKKRKSDKRTILMFVSSTQKGYKYQVHVVAGGLWVCMFCTCSQHIFTESCPAAEQSFIEMFW